MRYSLIPEHHKNPNPDYVPPGCHFYKKNCIKQEPYYIITKNGQYLCNGSMYPSWVNDIEFAQKFWSVSSYNELSDYRKLFPHEFANSKLIKVEPSYTLTEIEKVRTGN